MAVKHYCATKEKPKDVSIALWAGILFSFAFTGLIWILGPTLPQINFLPDQGFTWYYWKLPEPTFWSRATAWGGYLFHQLAIWCLIYWGQRQKLKYTHSLHRLNVLALATNVFFIILHLAQTHIWYDGLAQDVSIQSSQASVVIILVVVLLMENQRRGLFFGKKIGFLRQMGQVARRYHGYLFAWGIIYTFWYHPMETTPGHLIGFLYTFFLLLQSSLMFTRAHVHRWWMVVQEVTVLFHGTLVAYLTQGADVWPMFFFGFATIFIVTQMYGLGLHRWQRWAFVGAYIAALVAVYSSRGWLQLNEILRIPLIEYLLVFVLALLIWLGIWVLNWLRQTVPALAK